MKSISLLNIAASIAAIIILVIILILVPEPLWTTITITTAIGFSGSVGYMFYVPSIFRQHAQTTDASQMAAVGLLSTVSIVLLMATGGGLALALIGYQHLGLALLVFGIGVFLVMSLVLNAALKVVEDISEKWSRSSHHVNWQNQVTILVSHSTHQESLEKLRGLLEKLRYSASDVPGGSPQDAGINQIFSVMLEQLQSDPTTDLKNKFDLINNLLAQRDVYLHTARSKA